MSLTVGGQPVNRAAERELYREIRDPHYRRQKDELAAADYRAELKSARERIARLGEDALERIDSRSRRDVFPPGFGLEEVEEERSGEGA